MRKTTEHSWRGLEDDVGQQVFFAVILIGCRDELIEESNDGLCVFMKRL
jgi:hypothetical protein